MAALKQLWDRFESLRHQVARGIPRLHAEDEGTKILTQADILPCQDVEERTSRRQLVQRVDELLDSLAPQLLPATGSQGAAQRDLQFDLQSLAVAGRRLLADLHQVGLVAERAVDVGEDAMLYSLLKKPAREAMELFEHLDKWATRQVDNKAQSNHDALHNECKVLLAQMREAMGGLWSADQMINNPGDTPTQKTRHGDLVSLLDRALGERPEEPSARLAEAVAGGSQLRVILQRMFEDKREVKTDIAEAAVRLRTLRKRYPELDLLSPSMTKEELHARPVRDLRLMMRLHNIHPGGAMEKDELVGLLWNHEAMDSARQRDSSYSLTPARSSNMRSSPY